MEILAFVLFVAPLLWLIAHRLFLHKRRVAYKQEGGVISPVYAPQGRYTQTNFALFLAGSVGVLQGFFFSFTSSVRLYLGGKGLPDYLHWSNMKELVSSSAALRGDEAFALVLSWLSLLGAVLLVWLLALLFYALVKIPKTKSSFAAIALGLALLLGALACLLAQTGGRTSGGAAVYVLDAFVCHLFAGLLFVSFAALLYRLVVHAQNKNKSEARLS